MRNTKINYHTSKKERLSYSGFFAGQNIIYILVLQFLTIFYTDEVGLSTSAVALLFMVARIWDAVNDPILGSIVDRVQPKKGKFLPWIKAVSVFMPLTTFILFIKVGNGGAVSLIYAYVTYIIWGMVYTISDIPIFALSISMTDNIEERTSLISAGRLATGIAVLVATILAAPMIAEYGYAVTVLFLMIISLITMFPIRFFAKERFIYKKEENANLKATIKYLKANKYLLAFYGAAIISGSFGFHKVLMVYFAKWNLGDIALQSVISLAMTLPLIFLPIFTPMLVRKLGKIKLLKISFILIIVCQVANYIIGYENFGLFMTILTIGSCGSALPGILVGMITSDCVEYGAYKTGERLEGIVFSVQTFSTKLITAFSGALGILFLGFFGYDQAATVQSPEVLDGIYTLITLVPSIGTFIAFLIFSKFYKLKESDVQAMVDEMQSKNMNNAV